MRGLLWPLYLAADLISVLLAYILAPLIALWPEDKLRTWRWFLTPDNPITGDESHERRWAGKPRYLKKVAWLWRNKAYGFSKDVLGARTYGPVTLRSTSEARIGDKRGVEGLELYYTPEGYWQLYLIHAWNKKKCLRLNLGWKLWNEDLNENPTFGMFVATLTPYKEFRSK